MPFEDLTGGSGFTSDSDGATANLDITMSDQSARNLWDVQAAVQQIATDFQTAVRAASDFNSYLISIRETGQTIKMPALNMEGSSDTGNLSYAGGRVDSGSVPMTGGEAGMASRIAEMEENSSGDGSGVMGSRAPNAAPVDVGGFVQQVSGTLFNASFMHSMGRGGGMHGGPAAPAVPPSEAEAMRRGGLGTGEISPEPFGGSAATSRAMSALGWSRAISGGLQAGRGFMAGGGAGGAMSLLGRAGAYGALAYGAYQLVDTGIQTYAQSRAMAIASNNSAQGPGWGFGQRVGQAGMAMSPYVSQEDAANIYNSAIDQGWASRSNGFQQGDFSSAVNFMYDAAKDYNMTPQQSSQLLQSSTLGAGESVSALNEQLLTLKKTLDGTGVSMAAATQTYTALNGSLINMGMSPQDASLVATGGLSAFSGNTRLGPTGAGASYFVGAMSSPNVQAMVGALTGNLPAAAFAGPNAQKGTAAWQQLVHSLALQYSSMTGMSEQNRAAMFMTAYNSLVPDQPLQNEADALSYMNEAAANPNFQTDAQANVKNTLTLQHQNSVQSWYHGLDDWGGWDSSQTGNGPSLSDQEKDSALINSYNNYSPEINSLLTSAGDNLQNYVLYGPDGKPVMDGKDRVAGANIAKWIDQTGNYQKFSDPKGGYYIQDQSGNKWNAGNIGSGGASTTTTSGANSSNTVYITLSPQAQQYFATNVNQLNLATGASTANNGN